MERVASLLQREIARILSRDFSDQLRPMVTVTSVRVTADLSIAYIYLSIMGESRAGKDSVLAHLKELTPRIRGTLGKAIRHQVKSIPELRFFLDESLENAKRMDDLLGRLKDERRRRGVDEGDNDLDVPAPDDKLE